MRGAVPVVPGDGAVVRNLHARWANALRSGIIFAVHLTLVTAMLAALLFVYVRRNLFDRIVRVAAVDPES